MSPKIKLSFIVIPIICLTAFVAANRASVKLTNQQNKSVVFKIKSHKTEWVNNVINIAILSVDNKLIQINNIPESFIADTCFKSNRLNILMIDGNDTYLQSKEILSTIKIKSKGAQAGNILQIRAKGRFFATNKWHTFDIKSEQELPQEKTLGTSKKMMN